LNEIRQATNTEWLLGNARFRERIEALTGRQAQPKPWAVTKDQLKITIITNQSTLTP